MEEWSRLGAKDSSDGSRIMGHIPKNFPEAYLHSFFAPLPLKNWKAYLKLPSHLTELFSECNGLSLFFDCLSIYGIRQNYRRDLGAQFQPYDLKQHDHEHRTIFHPLSPAQIENRVFFGSYRQDGSGVFTAFDSPKVFRCLRNQNKPVNSWKHLEVFLKQEYDRLEVLHDKSGYLINKKKSTTPANEML
jgi:hypothetical protein